MTQELAAQKLEAEKIKLEAEMGGIGRRNLAVPNDWEALPSETGGKSDLVDQADVTMSREGNIAILADLEARYDLVLVALESVKNGTYGTCSVCGKAIEKARLEADPAAHTCREHL